MEKEIKNIEEEIKNYSDSSTGGIEKFRINFVSKKSVINKIFEEIPFITLIFYLLNNSKFPSI